MYESRNYMPLVPLLATMAALAMNPRWALEKTDMIHMPGKC
jgi:hypothetical protein